MAKNEKVTMTMLMKKWMEKYTVPSSSKSVKIENNDFKNVVESQENWVKQNESLLKYWGAM